MHGHPVFLLFVWNKQHHCDSSYMYRGFGLFADGTRFA